MCVERVIWLLTTVFVTLFLANFTSTSTIPRTINENDTIIDVEYTVVNSLYKDLMDGYDKRVRPVRNQSQSLEVNFLFCLYNIVALNTASQKLSILATFFVGWKDEILSWNPENYDGAKLVKFATSEVWTPAVVISKSIDGHGIIGKPTDLVSYTNDGYALWSPDGLFDVICEVNTRYYPFDLQICNITIYVSDSLSSEVELESLQNGAITDRIYSPNSAWKLVGTYTDEKYYVGVKLVTIVLELRRRKAYLLFTVISPLILLSILNVGVFLVPVDSGEKGSIAVTIFLSYVVFISTINDELPHNSINHSYLLNYILLLLILSVCTVLYSFAEAWVYIYYAEDEVNNKLIRALFKTSDVIRQRNNTQPIDLNTSQPAYKESSTVHQDTETLRTVKRKLNNSAPIDLTNSQATDDKQNIEKLPIVNRKLNENPPEDPKTQPPVEINLLNGQQHTEQMTWRRILRRIDITMFCITFAWNLFITVGHMIFLAFGRH